jgi:hypothetical protein
MCLNNNKQVAAFILPLSAATVLLVYFSAAQDLTSDSFFTLHIESETPTPAIPTSTSTMSAEDDEGEIFFFDEEVEEEPPAQKAAPVAAADEEEEEDLKYQYSPPPHMVEPAKGKKRGIFGRLFGKKRRKVEESPVMKEEEDLVLTDEPVGFVDDVPLPPIVEASLPSSRPEFDLATAGKPLALLFGLLLLVVARRVFTSGSKVDNEEEAQAADARATNGGDAMSLASDHSVDEIEPPTSEQEEQLKQTLQREAAAKKKLDAENKALQDALNTHKSTVDKFNMELQARNERLSVFEQEQETVRKQLSSQIEVLKQELQERQKQEQGNLKSKESLCNDLITKIKALNQDLENHEKLWQGVAKKAEQKGGYPAKVLEGRRAKASRRIASQRTSPGRIECQAQAIGSSACHPSRTSSGL